jgi:hypothetical protein
MCFWLLLVKSLPSSAAQLRAGARTARSGCRP